MTKNQIVLNPSSVARVLGSIAILLVLLSVGIQLAVYFTGHNRMYGLVYLLHLNAEYNIPTAFSALLLLFSALLLAVIANFKIRQHDLSSMYWSVLSIGFLFMAGDELWQIHESLTKPTNKLLGDNIFAIFHFSWVIPAGILVFILGLFFLRFLISLSVKTRKRFLIAAVVYLSGAIGFELLGGWYAKLHGIWNFPYQTIATIEEALEMAGVILFIRALLKYIKDNYAKIQFKF